MLERTLEVGDGTHHSYLVPFCQVHHSGHTAINDQVIFHQDMVLFHFFALAVQ
jgi:hypothetical protein